MSQENVELHGRAYEAFNARDIDAFIAHFDPNVEWHSVMTVPGGADWRTSTSGEHTLSFAVMHGRGRQSGDVTEDALEPVDPGHIDRSCP
jgi:hypothetical protein